MFSIWIWEHKSSFGHALCDSSKLELTETTIFVLLWILFFCHRKTRRSLENPKSILTEKLFLSFFSFLLSFALGLIWINTAVYHTLPKPHRRFFLFAFSTKILTRWKTSKTDPRSFSSISGVFYIKIRIKTHVRKKKLCS